MDSVTAFVFPTVLPLRHAGRRHQNLAGSQQQVRRIRRTCRMVNQDSSGSDAPNSSQPQPSQQFAPPSEPVFGRFDPGADTDAFGRDPKKETEFWKDHAKSVLESTEVQDAIEKHQKDGGDGMTDEQRAYMEFIRQLDEGKSGEGKSETDDNADGQEDTRL